MFFDSIIYKLKKRQQVLFYLPLLMGPSIAHCTAVYSPPPDVIKLMGWENIDIEFEAKAYPKTGKLTIAKK